MSKKDVANLACKLLALYTIVNGLTGGLSGLATVSAILADNRGRIGPSPLKVVLMSCGPFLIYIFVGIGLWYLSDRISNFIANEIHLGKNESLSKKTVEEVQTIAFSVLGLFFIGGALSKAVSPIISLLMVDSSNVPIINSQVQYANIGKLLEVVIQLAFGLWLLLGTQGLVYVLKRVRKAGVQQDRDSESHPDGV